MFVHDIISLTVTVVGYLTFYIPQILAKESRSQILSLRYPLQIFVDIRKCFAGFFVV